MQSPSLGRPVDAAPEQATTRAGTRKLIVATSLGNGLEIFDFTVFSFFAVHIGAAFFPSHDPLTSLLLAVGTFGAGFFARPLGAFLIGSYADRVGRRAAMSMTIWLMAIGTCAIALCPTYAQIGVAAPLIVLAGRLLQGFSAGGEVGASTTLLMESGEARRQGYMVSWQMTSQGVAALTGAVFGLVLTRSLPADAVASWGWRLPFLIGLLIAPIGYYIRRHLPDHHAQAGAEKVESPLRELFVNHGRAFFVCTVMIISGTVSTYTMVYFMPSYLARVMHLPATVAFSAAVLASGVIIVVSPIAGYIADRVTQRKQLAIVLGLIGSVCTLPAFWLLTHVPTPAVVLGVVALMVALMVLGIGNGFLMMMEAFPESVRASGFAASYATGVTLFGGTAQFVVTALVVHTGQPFSAGIYVFAANIVSLVAVFAYRAAKNPAKGIAA
ncbi:MFS transporter [Burkholderia guangdongensis]|uniref:MFS transporter n=1 Tax=Burkholderia guangdongensis TaxID=1792500 RepID=UPI0015CAA3EE|nr:MFS transporter [Burkholderia guangdongensis]